MKATAKGKLLSIFAALVLIFALAPFGEAQANEAGDMKILGFVPNSWDASVSKVDLVTLEEIARYDTAPRDGVDVRSWRTNRMAMDADGNAWVLNTGTDAFRFGPDAGLQGQLVRIQGDTRDLANTQQYGGPSLDFGDDDAVQVFDIGGVNDMPRAIAVDDDGSIWVGFYGSGELHQYTYDEAEQELDVAVFTPEDQIAFYDMQFAPNGELFISSRQSTPSFSATFGIFRFDGQAFFLEQGFNSPYALLAAPDGTVFATAYNNVLRIRDAGAGTWSQVTISGARNLRGMQLDALEEENLWIADTTAASGGNRVYWFELSSGNSGFVTLEKGDTPVGVGREPSGLMWVIARTDGGTNNNTPLNQRINGFIESIDPSTKEVVGFIEVGPRPYAYGDFFVETPPVELCFDGSETAWANGGAGIAKPNWDFVRGNNWGWTNGPLAEGSYEFDIYAGAGRNDISRGTLVGTLSVDYADGNVTVRYQLTQGSFLGETHLWVGNEELPTVRRGRRTEFTNAPGQFPYGEGFGFDPDNLSDAENVWEWSGSGFDGDIYVAAHSVVWTGVECEE